MAVIQQEIFKELPGTETQTKRAEQHYLPL